VDTVRGLSAWCSSCQRRSPIARSPASRAGVLSAGGDRTGAWTSGRRRRGGGWTMQHTGNLRSRPMGNPLDRVWCRWSLRVHSRTHVHRVDRSDADHAGVSGVTEAQEPLDRLQTDLQRDSATSSTQAMSSRDRVESWASGTADDSGRARTRHRPLAPKFITLNQCMAGGLDVDHLRSTH
jgi:hypothetical protein